MKWMSYFDEIEALCAVQAAFSDDFSFVMSELSESETSASFDPLSASVPALDPIDFSCPEPLSFCPATAEHSGAEDSEAKRSKAKKNMESCWSVHVRAMCKACGASVKIDKDRVCSDAWSTSEVGTPHSFPFLLIPFHFLHLILTPSITRILKHCLNQFYYTNSIMFFPSLILLSDSGRIK